MILNSENVIIFTDGSARGNPGPGGYAAIIISPESNNNRGKLHATRYMLHELGGREEHTTNNRMELVAAIQALSFVSSNFTLNAGRYTLFSDSSYLVNGITKWVGGWQKNGWRTKTKQPVENQDLWEKLVAVTADKSIDWKLIGGHIGVAGNERSDEIATSFADGLKPKLYSGALENYPIKNILNLIGLYDISYGRKENKRKSRTPAYSYISMVDGVIETHKTWAECEKRVKGKSNVKFKKVFSVAEEAALIRDWS